MHELVRFDPAVEVVWRAFELRPEPVATLDPRGEYLQRVWENSVYLMAERLGKTMKLPPVQPAPAWHMRRHTGRVSKDASTTITRRFFAAFLKEGKAG